MLMLGSDIIPQQRQLPRKRSRIVETPNEAPPAAATCLNNPYLSGCSSSGAEFKTCEAALEICVLVVSQKAWILSAWHMNFTATSSYRELHGYRNSWLTS